MKFVLTELKDFKLGIECIKELAEILIDDSEIKNIKEKIKALTSFIIVELRNKKFSDKTIKEIMDNIFSKYDLIPDGGIYTKFPHSIKFTEVDDIKEYYDKVKKYIDSLTIKDRILALETYFKREAKEVIFIFQTEGLKYDKSFEKINGIKIYNPLYKQLIDKAEDETIRKQEFPPELFYNETKLDDILKNKYDIFCNMAIQISMIDYEYSKSEAVEKANKFFSIFTSRKISLKCELKILTNSFVVIDKDGKLVGYSISNKVKHPLVHSIDLQYFECPENYAIYYSDLINTQNLDKIDRKIIESTNWKIKALEANNYNEAILWHWVSIENLFEVDKENANNIFNFAPQILTESYIYNFIQQIMLTIHYDILPSSFFIL